MTEKERDDGTGADVLEAAREAVTATAIIGDAFKARVAVGLMDDSPLIKAACWAIMAERERCATYIEQRPGKIPDRQEIAAAIRKGALSSAPRSAELPPSRSVPQE